MTNHQNDLAEQFRALHHAESPLLIPNAWDAMSARIFESVGFFAIATTSGGLSWSLGYQDGEKAPWDEVHAATKRIVRVVSVPVTADIESGYAETLDELRRHVADIIGAGVAGINLEDQKGGKLRSVFAATERIAVAREAAVTAGIPIVINARTDVYQVKTDSESGRFDETIRRAKAYQEAGADCIFIFGLSDVGLIAELVSAIELPVNIVGRPGLPKVSELAKFGVRRISLASSIALHAFGCTQGAAARLFATGQFEPLEGFMARATAQTLLAETQR